MRAYCGKAVYEAHVRPTEDGVKEFRASVQEAVLDGQIVSLSGTVDEMEQQLTKLVPVLVAIKGGKA
jgi:hypothetical protein